MNPDPIIYLGIPPDGARHPIFVDMTIALRYCINDTDYENGLKSLWSSDRDIIVAEPDLVFSETDILALVECPFIACAYAYKLHPESTGLNHPVYAHRWKLKNPEAWPTTNWISENEPYADLVGLGLTKLSRFLRREITKWEEGTWHTLDSRLSEAVNAIGMKFHIHWPELEHKHQ